MGDRVYFQSESLVHNPAPKEEGQTKGWPFPKPWVFTRLFRPTGGPLGHSAVAGALGMRKRVRAQLAL